MALGFIEHLHSRNQMDMARNSRAYSQTVFECSGQRYSPDDPNLHTACSQTWHDRFARADSVRLENALLGLVRHLVRGKWFDSARLCGRLVFAVDGTLREDVRSSTLPEREKRRYALEVRIVTPWGWNIPVLFEEVLANAVYHKSYRIAEPITVVVPPEAMTISSLPGPERSITDADLAACRMIGLHYRNRRIGDFLKELDLVEGRNTGIPVVVNVMRENGSPPSVFSSPENRDWLSVTLPVNPHFCKMENPISQKTALTSQGGANKDIGEEFVKLADTERIVGVMTAEEELAQIKVALKIALKTALIRRSAKVVERMGILLQQLLRDKDITIGVLASLLGASRRTVQEDIAILKSLKVLDRIGPDNGGEWVVLLKW